MPQQLTYCNPLPLPDYPRGRMSFNKERNDLMWVAQPPRDFRETADPSVIYFQGKWYLYPSAGMAYVSDDGATWRHHRIEPYDCGYAPTVVLHRGRFYLTACHAPLYVADDPLGPFVEVGPMLDCQGNRIEDWSDPMLFGDDDGQLYAYWGLGGDGIKGVRLDPDKPNCALSPRTVMFKYDPSHVWERYGERNEDISKSFVEGPWMVKVNVAGRGRYFLTYTAPGTEFSSYGMGTYVGDAPLGPFTYQQRNPICADRHGLVRGPGHGCIVAGPNDTLWAFYTHIVRGVHIFERRVGMDPAGIDAQGNLFVLAASETPQHAPGFKPRPQDGNDAGLLPVNHAKAMRASSSAPGRTPDYANDSSLRTWWQPAENDAQPWLMSHLGGRFEVSAIRLAWTEPGLDYDAGIIPRPLRYLLELSPEPQGDHWVTALDCRDNRQDLLIDYRSFAPLPAARARLTLIDWPSNLAPGIADLSLFGRCESPSH